MMPDCAGAGGTREQHAGGDRRARGRYAQLGHIQGQNRPERAVDELQAEYHTHQQDEVLEREHVAKSDALGRRL